MDFNALVDRLKGQGLDLAEEAAKLVVIETIGWLGDEVLKSENKYDDLLLAVFPLVKDAILKQVDKIDGEVG